MRQIFVVVKSCMNNTVIEIVLLSGEEYLQRTVGLKEELARRCHETLMMHTAHVGRRARSPYRAVNLKPMMGPQAITYSPGPRCAG